MTSDYRALATKAKELCSAGVTYHDVPALADAVIDLLAENERLRSENEDCRLALAAVSAGIWRDKERNAKGLAGGSLVVELVEAAIQHQHKGANP